MVSISVVSEMGVGCDGKELNTFQWERVELNLPGTKEYDSGYPREGKMDR
jgi:hypothetical protein